MKRSAQAVLKNPRPDKKGKKKGDYQSGRELLPSITRELKAFDVAASTLVINPASGTPNFALLNAMVNGAEYFQRVGRKIYMRSVHLRGLLAPTATTVAAVPDLVRVIIFYDAQPNGVAPTITALLQDANAGAATSGVSEINLNNRARFKIIRDYQIGLPAITVTAGALVGVQTGVQDMDRHNSIDMFCKLKGLESEYNGTNGGTIADITSGSLYVTAFSSSLTGQWQLGFGSRVRYYD